MGVSSLSSSVLFLSGQTSVFFGRGLKLPKFRNLQKKKVVHLYRRTRLSFFWGGGGGNRAPQINNPVQRKKRVRLSSVWHDVSRADISQCGR